MRSLISFLLEETMLYESKMEPPTGYQKFPTRGPITNQLKDLLQIDSAKEMKLDNENLKITTPEGREKIVADLNLSGASNFQEVFIKISNASKMSDVFVGKSQKLSIGEDLDPHALEM